jgi:hypothetical protein
MRSDNQHVFVSFAFGTFDFLTSEIVDFYRVVMHNNVMSHRFMNIRFTQGLILPSKEPNSATYCHLAFYSCVISMIIL